MQKKIHKMSALYLKSLPAPSHSKKYSAAPKQLTGKN